MTTSDTCGAITATTLQPLPIPGDPVNTYAALPSLGWIPTGLRLVWVDGPDRDAYGNTRVMTSTSADVGATWSPPEDAVIFGARDTHVSFPTGHDTWLSYFVGVSPERPALGVYGRPSRDNGATWDQPRRIDPNLPYAGSSAPIRATGATLWQPFYGRTVTPTDTGADITAAGTAAGGELEEYDSAYLGRSDTGGARWLSWRIADGQRDGRHYSDPWLLVACTRLMVFHRYGEDHIGVTESTDAGRTWTIPRPLFPGTGKPAAVKLSTGELVVIYRDPVDHSARYAVSCDCAETWDEGIPLLADSETALAMVHAAPFEVAPSRLYVVVGMEESDTVARLWHTTIAP